MKAIGGFQKKLLARQWAAHQAVPLKCGSQFHFTQDARTIYMEVLINNITDAILLISL